MEENSQQARKAQPVQNMSETIWVEECLRRLRSPRIANPDESGPADAPPVSSLAMELQSCRYENYKYDDRGVEMFSRKQRGKFGGQLFRSGGTYSGTWSRDRPGLDAEWRGYPLHRIDPHVGQERHDDHRALG